MCNRGKRKSHLFHGDLIGVMNSAEGAYFGGWWMDGGAVKRWPLRLKSTESNGPNDVDITI